MMIGFWGWVFIGMVVFAIFNAEKIPAFRIKLEEIYKQLSKDLNKKKQEFEEKMKNKKNKDKQD